MVNAVESEIRERFYYQMTLIRRFEERVFELFADGELFGTTHTYIGQEANAVAVLNHLQDDDIVVSNHRCHGHYLARTGDVEGLLAELMGKTGGVCGGRGGSQHLCNGSFYTNGVQGSTVPIAAGMAYVEKMKGTDAITVLFVGDGTFGQGTVYETFNLASLWQVPLLIVVENNRYAQTTPLDLNFAGSFVARARAFDLSVAEIESNDVEKLYHRFGHVMKNIRTRKKPHVEIIHTYRLCPHSKGDDYRPSQELEEWQAKDPLKILGQRIASEDKQETERQVCARIEQAEDKVREMPFPTLEKQASHIQVRGA
ncbi:MAG: thiamine pyrophosphate-dependent dehydrogenase E1 component subunit alpha [Chloroflexi bacterium]|nr:MAG: thiamine pyrophosphate-dependent dehydrogenase E1 component subunit alpha [Chloroflexota bacterium]RLC87729.1 MAG: thiamine pyrophosphate-dependent dehydrogenase E1 component subunit alpha [Chloroflexota bacterium]